MKKIKTIILTSIIAISLIPNIEAYEIDYSSCTSLQDAVFKETEEINYANPSNYPLLAQLHVSRGESYLLNAQYEEAVTDFKNANSYIGYGGEEDIVTAFRIAFGEVISYDNLGMHEQTQEAFEQLQTIVNHVGCDDCLEYKPCQEQKEPTHSSSHYLDMIKLASYTPHLQSLVSLCKNRDKATSSTEKEQNSQQSSNDTYSDVIGPDSPPYASWCEEAVTATGSVMIGIACLAPNNGMKIALTSIINALMVRGVKCCQAGGFWKACVAPVCRKMREWELLKKRNLVPNPQNLHLYTN